MQFQPGEMALVARSEPTHLGAAIRFIWLPGTGRQRTRCEVREQEPERRGCGRNRGAAGPGGRWGSGPLRCRHGCGERVAKDGEGPHGERCLQGVRSQRLSEIGCANVDGSKKGGSGAPARSVMNSATGTVLMQDRQTKVALDLANSVAAKTALQLAGVKLADRIVARIAATK